MAVAVAASAWLARSAGRPTAAANLALGAHAAPPAPPAHAAAAAGTFRSGPDTVRTARLTADMALLSRTPRQIAWHLLVHRFHWKHWQFKYLDLLWTQESGWNRYASNPYSGAYGIPQAVPGSKMAAAGPRWRSSARTQIRWGMLYIHERYRTPYWAWRNERWYGWY